MPAAVNEGRTDMESKAPTIIDLDAKPQTHDVRRADTANDARGARRQHPRNWLVTVTWLLLLGTSAGNRPLGRRIPEVRAGLRLDGAATLDIVQEDGAQSFALSVGMSPSFPQSAWHRFSLRDGQDHDERDQSPGTISISMLTTLGRYWRRPH